MIDKIRKFMIAWLIICLLDNTGDLKAEIFRKRVYAHYGNVYSETFYDVLCYTDNTFGIITKTI